MIPLSALLKIGSKEAGGTTASTTTGTTTKEDGDDAWYDKQDAVDELFEEVENELRELEGVLGANPDFGSWVETALEEYLETRAKEAEEEEDKMIRSLSSSSASSSSSAGDDDTGTEGAGFGGRGRGGKGHRRGRISLPRGG